MSLEDPSDSPLPRREAFRRARQETSLCPRGVEMDRPNNGLVVSAAPSRQRLVHSPCMAFRSEAASGLPWQR